MAIVLLETDVVKVATSVRMPRKAAVTAFLERRGLSVPVRFPLTSSILGRDPWELQTLKAGGRTLQPEIEGDSS